MRIKVIGCSVLTSLLLSLSNGAAADPTSAETDLKDLVTKIETKLKAGQASAADLAPELKEFDALIAKHKGEKTDDAAQILYMKAQLYKQVLKDNTQSDRLMAQIKQDYPDSDAARRAGLAVGSKFPDFDEKGLDGKPLSVATYKGKVVLLDFWATWCPPCRAELPNVLKTYEAHHKAGFEIIGISLDQDKQKLTSFIEDKKMPWAQYFDGKGWGNKLAQKYGVQSIPATYLIDRQGTIIGKDLRGEELEEAVAKAVAKK